MSVRRKRQNTGRVPELVVFWGVLCCAVLYCAVRRCEMLPAACWRGLDGNWKWKIGIGVVGKRAQRHRASAADTLSHEGFNEDEWGAQGMRGHALIQADGGGCPAAGAQRLVQRLSRWDGSEGSCSGRIGQARQSLEAGPLR